MLALPVGMFVVIEIAYFVCQLSINQICGYIICIFACTYDDFIHCSICLTVRIHWRRRQKDPGFRLVGHIVCSIDVSPNLSDVFSFDIHVLVYMTFKLNPSNLDGLRNFRLLWCF